MQKLLKKNSLLLGISLAALSPLCIYLLLSWLVPMLSDALTEGIPLIKDYNIAFLSILLNMILFSSYIHKKPYDKTGRGIMIMTFIYTIAYIIWRFGGDLLS